jgi:hypothetical protein
MLSHSIHSSTTLHSDQSSWCPTVFTHTSLCPMPSPHAVPQYSLSHHSALCPVHMLPTVFTPSLCPIPSPHCVPQYSLIHRSVLCPVHTLSHSIHSYIALPYVNPHAVPQYSLLHRSAICPLHTLSNNIDSYIALLFAQSTRCPTVFTPPLLCPMPSPHAVPHFSLIHRSTLCPVHTLSHNIHSSIALPYAQSTRCPASSSSHCHISCLLLSKLWN